MFSVLLACGASLAWGSSDFLAGIGCRRVRLALVLFISQILGLALLLPALVLARQGPPALHYCLLAALAGLFNAAALAAFYKGLARGPISLVAPIAASEGIIPLAVGLWDGERLSVMSAVGIAVALGGIVLAARPQRTQDREQRKSSHLPSIVLGGVAAVCFGLFVVSLKAASQGGALWAVTFSRTSTIAALLIALPVVGSKLALPRLVRPRRALARLTALRADLPALLAVGALDVGASTMFAVAATRGELSVIGVLGSYYPVVTVVLAGLVLRERLGGWQRLGTLGALTGVVLIAAR